MEVGEHKPVFCSPEEVMLAHSIVYDELGEQFQLVRGVYPPNKGVKGDGGIYGETVAICSELEDPLRFLIDEHEILAKVAKRLCNEIHPITKVLFEIKRVENQNT